MATFEAQVEGLTSLSIDGSSAPTQTELTQFLTDGAKEVINLLPEGLLPLCSSSVSFTSGSASTLNTGKVLHVLRSDGDISQPCRSIPAMYKGKYSDPDDMNYATVTDPAFYVENNTIDVLPAGGSCTYSEVQYPAVAYGDSAIAVFPDEAEYLVPIYASIKSLQNVLGDKSSNSDITTALTAINTEMDETQAVCDKIDADLVLAKAEVVLAKAEAAELATQTDNGGDFETAVDAMATELAKVDNIIVEASTEFDKVDNVIVEGSVEFDKSDALLDLGEADTETAVNTAAAKIITELDETQAVCDKIDADLVLAKAEVVLAKAEAAELATQTDNSSTFNTALAAIATELNKADEIIVQASEEFDEVATQTSGSVTSAITSARSAAPSVLSIDDLNVNAVLPVAPSAPSFDAGAISISASAPAYSKTSLTLGTAPTISDLNINAVLPVAPSLSTVSYSDATNADASAATITTASASAPSIINVSGNAPSYTKPSLTSRVAFSSYTSGLTETDPGVLSITAVSPSSPSLTSVTFVSVDSDIDASLPTYTTATVSAGGVYGANTPPAYTKPSTALSLGQVSSYIDGEEDVELASAKLQQVSAELNEYQADIQNEQNEFNKENVAYQANIQEAMQEIQVANQRNIAAAQGELQLNLDNENRSQQRAFQNAINDMKAIFDNNAQIMQKYQAEVSKYQADVAKEVQEYQQKLSQYSLELNTAYTAWAKTESDTFQQYQLDIQNELNEYNKENAVYQIEFKEAADKNNVDLQVAVSNANNLAQEYRQESQQTTDVDKFNKAQDQALALANAAKQIEDLIADNNSKLQKYSAELQSYQSQVNKDVQEYQQNLEGDLQVWYQQRQTDIQKYSGDIQDELNEFNKEQAVFQNELQEKIQEATNQQTKDSAEYSAKLQKYSSELQSYQGQVNKDVQEYQANLQQRVQEFDSSRKLQQSYLEEAQSGIAAGNAYIQEAQAVIAQAGGYAAEVSARAGFSGAKSQAIQGHISTAQSYVATAQGFGNEVQAKVGIANGYIAEITIRLQQAESKRQESQSRLAAGGAYLQEAQAIVAQGSAYIAEAQAYVSQAQGYAAEVSARAGFSSAKAQAVQGHINTAQSYVATAQGFGTEIQAKIGIAQGYSNEVQSRLGVDTAHYAWYEKQQAKLQQDYDRGLQVLIGGGLASQQQ